MTTCMHRPAGTKYATVRESGPLEVRVKCPCCHLPGLRDVGDLEPMFCPYCDRRAVDDDSFCDDHDPPHLECPVAAGYQSNHVGSTAEGDEVTR